MDVGPEQNESWPVVKFAGRMAECSKALRKRRSVYGMGKSESHSCHSFRLWRMYGYS